MRWHTRPRVCLHAHTWMYSHNSSLPRVHLYMYCTYTHTCTHTCVYTPMNLYMHTLMSAHIHRLAHSHTSTHSYTTFIKHTLVFICYTLCHSSSLWKFEGNLRWKLFCFSNATLSPLCSEWDVWMESHLLPRTLSWVSYWAAGSLWFKPQGLFFCCKL